MSCDLSRRRFLGSVAFASVAAAGWSRSAWATEPATQPDSSAAGSSAAAAPPAHGLQLGLQMYSLRGYDMETAVAHAHDLGFQHLEFYSGMLPLDWSAEQIATLQEKLTANEQRISAHGVNRFTKDQEKNRRVFDFARRAGVKIITADPTPDSLDDLEKLVAEYDIRIAIHNHGPTHHYNKVVDVLNALRDRHPHIGACADLGHFIRSGEDPVEVIRALSGRLYGVHLKDFAEQQDKTQGVILGRGHLDLVKVFDALTKADFPADGAISIEYEENPKNPLDDLRECQTAALEALKQLG